MTDQITYGIPITRIPVRLGSKIVGHIVGQGKFFDARFFYKPLGGDSGETFLSLDECKQSLEEPDND